MAAEDACVEDNEKPGLGLFFDYVSEHVESEVVEVELDPASEHETAGNKAPVLVLVGDSRLELGEEHVLNTVPVADLPRVVDQVHRLH